ncbi:MAG: hypothetical protein WC548_00285 [Candidatus Pacearchaeota archaeon]
MDVPNIRIEKREKGSRTFEELALEIKETMEGHSYKKELIKRMLKEKSKLRKTYGVLLNNSPGRIGEFVTKLFMSKNTAYNYLYSLIELGLLKQISIMDIWNVDNLQGDNKIVMDKFKEWSSKMAKRQMEYFAAKTHYFILTELGKDIEIISWVLKLEKEQKITTPF